MILSQAVSHTNSLYHEWGLIAAVLGLCVPLLGGVWWLLKLKSEDTIAAALKIRSSLAELMERAFHVEALRIFRMIDEQLPRALSQDGSDNPSPSAFDRLCAGLKKLDLDEPDRGNYRDLLEHALSGIISTEAEKLLGGATPVRVRFSFDFETERLLAYIAKQTALTRAKQKIYETATSRTTKLFTVAPLAALLGTPWVAFDALWAFYLSGILMLIFLASGAGGLLSLLQLATCQNWLTTRAAWSREDWFSDYA